MNEENIAAFAVILMGISIPLNLYGLYDLLRNNREATLVTGITFWTAGLLMLFSFGLL